MKIKGKSYFKDENADISYFKNWATQIEKYNGRQYERYGIETYDKALNYIGEKIKNYPYSD